jgi:hypothetical protein
MRWSLTTSLGLHAAILVAALVVLPNPNKYEIKPQQAIQVDISNIADQSKRMATAKEADTPKEKPAPKKADTVKKSEPAPKIAENVKKAVKEASAEPPPPPEPKKEEPKKEEPKPLDSTPLKDLIKDTVTDTPEPKKVEPKKEEPKEEQTKKAEAKPKEKPKKPEKKKPKFNPDEIAAFLNKIDETQAPERPSDPVSEPVQGEANLQGTDDRLSATIIEALVQKIRECWTVPPGAREANIIAKVHFGLNTDGTVIGVPEIMNPSADPLFDATARSAVAAVMECQAYSFLPRDKYDLWKDLIINFNPNMMFDS